MTQRISALFLVLSLILTGWSASTVTAQNERYDTHASTEALIRQGFSAIDHFEYELLDSLAGEILGTSTFVPRSQGYGNYFRGVARLFGGEGDVSRPHLQQAFALALEMRDDSLTAMTLNSLGVLEATHYLNVHGAQQYFLTSFDYARNVGFTRLMARIGCNMAELSIMQNDSTGYAYARQALQYAIDSRDAYIQFHGAYECACFARLKGNHHEVLDLLDQAEDLVRRNGFHNNGTIGALRALTLTDLGQIDEARVQADSAMTVSQGKGIAASDILYTYAYIANRQHHFQESNQWLQQAINVSELPTMLTNRVRCHQLMADNYRCLGRADDAFRSLEQAQEYTQRINSVDREMLIRERQTIFELAHGEQIARIREQQLRYSRRINAFLVIVLLLLAFILVAGLLVNRRRIQLYKSIVRRNLEVIRREKEQKQELDQLRQTHNMRLPKTSQSEDIYLRLCQLMDEKRLYADRNLTRESLAEMLGTNRTYLTEIIKERSNQSFSQFINAYRIQEALRVLSDNSRPEYPLKQLCSDLGYSSMTTFYKLFQQQVGISPSAYRKSLRSVDD